MTDDPIDSLFATAKANRVPMAAICRRAGIDPTTPSRWKRNKNGATLESVRRLREALNDILTASPQEERAA